MIDRSTRLRLLSVEDLPTLPTVMTQVLATVEDERSSAQDLTRILEMDQAISARVLRLANSAFYGVRHQVDTIRRAVVVIGFDAVRLLALATSVFDLVSRHGTRLFDPEDFWMHALGTAKAAQLLAAGRPVTSSEACFTAGLLHDIGQFVLALCIGDAYGHIIEEANSRSLPLVQVERERLQTDHAEAGSWVASKWGFPPMFVDTTRHLYSASAYRGLFPTEVQVVAAANVLAQQADFGATPGAPMLAIEESLAKQLGLSRENTERCIGQLTELREESRRLLKLLSED